MAGSYIRILNCECGACPLCRKRASIQRTRARKKGAVIPFLPPGPRPGFYSPAADDSLLDERALLNPLPEALSFISNAEEFPNFASELLGYLQKLPEIYSRTLSR